MRLERYGAVTVLPVMAAPAEYGEHLRARIDPLMTGIGPVEGAVALTAALARLEARGEAPEPNPVAGLVRVARAATCGRLSGVLGGLSRHGRQSVGV